ncbi:MAG TPA: ABC transporter substrate-binding protein [Negativicutes bacterium]|nr:ABC transporter substrate-binding protein [Negativicutes bacterium]
MKKRLLAVMLCAASLLLISACAKEADKVAFGDAGWDSMKFHNAVAMFIAESAYGLETDEVSGSTAVTYGALKNGDLQVYMETWTDTIATYKDDVSSGAITELGVNYADNVQGLYVPRYVIEGDPERGIEALAPDLKTVEDLKNYSDAFADPDDPSKGRIYGAISGWAIDEVMRNKVKFYGLDAFYNYVDPGSDAALAAAIAGAYEKGQPIVAYYWEPAWITGQYDLVLLEDAPYQEDLYLLGQCECPSIALTVCVNPDFYKTNPEFCEFLSHYQTSSALTSEALAYINNNDASYEDAAKWFLSEHNELLDEWLPADKAELVRDTLAEKEV